LFVNKFELSNIRYIYTLLKIDYKLIDSKQNIMYFMQLAAFRSTQSNQLASVGHTLEFSV